MNIPKLLMLSGILVLTQLSIFSQSKYPSKVIISGDTLALVPIPMLKQANLIFVDRDYYKSLSDTLRSHCTKLSFINSEQDKLIETMNTGMLLRKRTIDDDAVIIKGFSDLDKKNQKRIKLLKIERNTLGVGVIIALAKIFLSK